MLGMQVNKERRNTIKVYAMLFVFIVLLILIAVA